MTEEKKEDYKVDYSDFEPPTPVSPGKKKREMEVVFGKNDMTARRLEKLDRQLRLWGWHGQKKIDGANVLLLNGTAVGCEVLKNIILPGFGKFTVMDDAKVTPRDLGNNFFVTKDDLGENRAMSVARTLMELNPDVVGDWMKVNPMKIMKNNPDVFGSFNYVIASQMSFDELTTLCEICRKHNSRLVVVRSYGMCGYIRVFGFDHCIIESKLDNPIEDLRLYAPWPDLQKFADIQELEKMNDKDHSHTPFICLLLKATKKWKADHGGKLPKSDEETKAFRESIIKMARNWGIESNFEEAVQKSFLAYRETVPSEQVMKVLNDGLAKEENLTKETNNFWFLCYGVKKFMDNEGGGKLLPLAGTIPDMHSDTNRFVRMQSLYRRKHRADVKVVMGYIDAQIKKLGRKEEIEKEVVSFFCKYVYNLRMIHYPSIGQELDDKTINLEELEFGLIDKEESAVYYVLLRASDLYRKEKGQYPGEKMDDDLDAAAKELLVYVKKLLFTNFKFDEKDFAFSEEELLKYCREWARWGASEIHTISSLIGGVASQELIKLCTCQRIPVNNTWIYDGIKSKSLALQV